MQNVRTIGDHLLDRMAELGIRHLFGVPGDFNLAFLDHVIAHPAIDWVGTANELNAAYAADGYARCNGAGAILTTYGVGELSAINGIAGSYAEHVPVLHIVGAPSTDAQRAGLKMHHTLADGDFGHFARAHAEVTAAHAHLTADNAVAEIDRVLGCMMRERRPGYLVLPTDVARTALTAALPELPPDTAECDEAQLDAFCTHAGELLGRAGRTVVLADFLADRMRASRDVEALIRLGGWASATLSAGKGTLDETIPGFLGLYIGAASEPEVKDAVESADALIAVGTLFFDMATSGFTHRIDERRLIDIQPSGATVAGRAYPRVPMDRALHCLIELFRSGPLSPAKTGSAAAPADQPVREAATSDEPLSQANFWPLVQDFIRADDLVVAEQGTAFYGAVTLRLPKNVRFIGQPLWASIGHAIPAAFGAQTALPSRRTLVLVGDGSALLSIQELGSMLRDGMTPIVIVLNNSGYTVERAIHGPDQRYNDIALWDWQRVAEAMGRGKRSLSLRAATTGTFVEALDKAGHADCLTLIEVELPVLDVPPLLDSIARAIAARNAG
ncbi:indolepyruvate decarboxylase [Burkholderia sp. WAC0059]|uniref:alpha-keto acid decarboxylase family protein n=1 Tax=Burkholderia sp. WAC0059 TaxID=2066022 RepID=UPI000C7EA923|nr:thiamine pyrophosphate-binding protein [Burkholderia sp. WAC0059]PLZ04014.1 indolepyruvate decarboxylase [Burkholderia sp. WAC0059]